MIMALILAVVLPNASLTPGAVLPVSRAEICAHGYAKRARHPYDTAWRLLARAVRREYGVTGRGYRIDHLVPIEVGGAPFNGFNLWPEPIAESERKDEIENRVHNELCRGRISLPYAQRIFESGEWARGL